LQRTLIIIVADKGYTLLAHADANGRLGRRSCVDTSFVALCVCIVVHSLRHLSAEICESDGAPKFRIRGYCRFPVWALRYAVAATL